MTITWIKKKVGATALSALLGFALVGTTLFAPAHAASNILKIATSAGVTTWDPIQSFSTEAFYMTSI